VYTGVGAAINTASVRPGTSCAVWGAGGIGLNVIQGCRIAGALTVIAIDTNPRKLKLAQELGATEVLDASSGDPVQAVLELTQGRGADYTFEAIGNSQAMEQAYIAARRGGTCTIVGVGGFTQTFSIPAMAVSMQERTLKGSFVGGGASVRDFPRLLRWYREGKLKLDELITATYPLDDVQRAFDDMTAGNNARGVILF
jgi:S-(hydroxymethyl)glutathione dehydrogenase/alcohol dehydrogenase